MRTIVREDASNSVLMTLMELTGTLQLKNAFEYVPTFGGPKTVLQSVLTIVQNMQMVQKPMRITSVNSVWPNALSLTLVRTTPMNAYLNAQQQGHCTVTMKAECVWQGLTVSLLLGKFITQMRFQGLVCKCVLKIYGRMMEHLLAWMTVILWMLWTSCSTETGTIRNAFRCVLQIQMNMQMIQQEIVLENALLDHMPTRPLDSENALHLVNHTTFTLTTLRTAVSANVQLTRSCMLTSIHTNAFSNALTIHFLLTTKPKPA